MRSAEPFTLLGFIPGNIRLFGIEDPSVPLFLFGSDKLGRDVFSRIFYAGRISLFIGFGGVFVSFILGVILGGISGYYGGVVDEAIQRVIEMLLSIPGIPLWIALSAALPHEWGILYIYSTGSGSALSGSSQYVQSWCQYAALVRGSREMMKPDR